MSYAGPSGNARLDASQFVAEVDKRIDAGNGGLLITTTLIPAMTGLTQAQKCACPTGEESNTVCIITNRHSKFRRTEFVTVAQADAAPGV